VLPMLLAAGVGAVVAALSVSGIVYYLASIGRLPVRGKAAEKAETVLPIATYTMPLEPLLVNLAGSSGSSYLRIALTLKIAAANENKGAKDKEEKSDKGAYESVPAVKDTVLSVLGQQTADELLAADGKEHLKAELKAALAKHNIDLKVTDVFFTDFLVQR
jgi:flagellar protein FliL